MRGAYAQPNMTQNAMGNEEAQRHTSAASIAAVAGGRLAQVLVLTAVLAQALQ